MKQCVRLEYSLDTEGLFCPYRVKNTLDCRSPNDQYEYCQKTRKSKTALFMHTVDAPLELEKYKENNEENIHSKCENYSQKKDLCLKFFEDNVSEKYKTCKEYSEFNDSELQRKWSN